MIVKLQGGLGNQMFQYAFAKSLESKGFEVFLDGSKYLVTQSNDVRGNACKIRNLELSSFNITLSVLYSFDMAIYARNYKDINKRSIFYRIYKNFIPKKYRRKNTQIFFSEYQHDGGYRGFLKYFKNIENLYPYYYFQGYFQNLIYFNDISDIIKKDFTYTGELSQSNKDIKSKIENINNSVFLHVRRGDYLDNDNCMFVKLGSTYYNNALKIMLERLSNPYVFVFSNDIAWCKSNFLNYIDSDIKKHIAIEFIEGNSEGNAIEEMELMRSCQHAIIANSSFSWWAAYLIKNQDKIVMMPSQILYDDEVNSKDIYPKDWIMLDYIWGDIVKVQN